MKTKCVIVVLSFLIYMNLALATGEPVQFEPHTFQKQPYLINDVAFIEQTLPQIIRYLQEINNPLAATRGEQGELFDPQFLSTISNPEVINLFIRRARRSVSESELRTIFLFLRRLPQSIPLILEQLWPSIEGYAHTHRQNPNFLHYALDLAFQYENVDLRIGPKIIEIFSTLDSEPLRRSILYLSSNKKKKFMHKYLSAHTVEHALLSFKELPSVNIAAVNLIDLSFKQPAALDVLVRYLNNKDIATPFKFEALMAIANRESYLEIRQAPPAYKADLVNRLALCIETADGETNVRVMEIILALHAHDKVPLAVLKKIDAIAQRDTTHQIVDRLIPKIKRYKKDLDQATKRTAIPHIMAGFSLPNNCRRLFQLSRWF